MRENQRISRRHAARGHKMSAATARLFIYRARVYALARLAAVSIRVRALARVLTLACVLYRRVRDPRYYIIGMKKVGNGGCLTRFRYFYLTFCYGGLIWFRCLSKNMVIEFGEV